MWDDTIISAAHLSVNNLSGETKQNKVAIKTEAVVCFRRAVDWIL